MMLELIKGKQRHWTELVLDKKKLTTRWGGTGIPMKSSTKTFGTPAKAKASYEAAVASKLEEGYRDPSSLGPPPKEMPRNEDFEAAIRANREDPAVYAVYADWLQQQGSPLGELIVVQQQNKKPRAAKLIDELGLPGDKVATYGWRSGFWQWLRIENEADWMNEKYDAAEVARNLFSRPMCAALEELRIGILRWDHNDVDVPAVLAEARKHAWAADLPKLHLGDVDRNIDMAHHMIGDVGKPISKAFPKLQRLKLHSSEQTWRGGGVTFGISGLDLPELSELVIETCSMSKKRLGHLLAAKLPRLEKLEVWFGSENYGCDASIKSLTKILDGSAFPRVRHLGLCNAEFQNDIAIAMASAKISQQLESLDLSMGTMTEVGAEALIAGAKWFRKLTALKLDKNFLPMETVRAVRKAFPFATADAQKEPDNSVAGETHYYVSVAE